MSHHTIWPLEMVPWSMRETNAIKNGVDVARAALYMLWNMVPWFIIKQMRTETAKLITCRPPYCFAEQWFHGS